MIDWSECPVCFPVGDQWPVLSVCSLCCRVKKLASAMLASSRSHHLIVLSSSAFICSQHLHHLPSVTTTLTRARLLWKAWTAARRFDKERRSEGFGRK